MPKKRPASALFLADLKSERAAAAKRVAELDTLIEGIEAYQAGYAVAPTVPGTKGNDGRAGHSPRYHGKRTSAGMHTAKKRGVRIGAPPVMDPDRIKEAEGMLAHGMSVSDVAAHFGVTRQTLYTRFNSKKIAALRANIAPAAEEPPKGPPSAEEIDMTPDREKQPLRVVR